MIRWFLALGLLIVLAAPAAHAYHLPVDLWELAQRSNLIVVALVLADEAEEGTASPRAAASAGP